METTFSHITITVKAENPKQAYAVLCETLQTGVKAGVLEYETADFCTDDDPDHDRSTSELFPNQEEE